ncbi:uncharacterized protein JN550_008418 [Neoarthrinium moseri]|uniref:uncharacterized protein n=1 Tax=Neoarthrinium moseri TaxID=1658444 RepID=UPI001FDD8693|nr:uncharacterized protein JN550_008418 [Neoarthrinium moseri]KAI1865370.1 hypothetical protein JN550_008418 [Neoarthrinium moseri]
MRLINVRTLEFEEFVGRDKPPYAILSHTWEDREVSFSQYRDWRRNHCRLVEEIQHEDLGREAQHEWQIVVLSDLAIDWDELIRDNAEHGPGLTKILNCAKEATKDGCGYIWVDTCCIDKSSSAELQEAINSMFRWYEEAYTCYAYLSDVTSSDIQADGSSFTKSRWFKRGWTLQELLAPSEVYFYNKNWTSIESRSKLSLKIEDITGIKSVYLRLGNTGLTRSKVIKRASVAQRMSWAAGRETTREEDIAYCLLGLFGIHMPMLYGEGDRAFRRLQEEIMRNSRDSSLFAWGYSGQLIPTDVNCDGILARSPKQFKGCATVRTDLYAKDARNESSMSQGLLRLRAPIVEDPIHKNLVYAVLSCRVTVTRETAPKGNAGDSSSDESVDRYTTKSIDYEHLVLPLISTRDYPSDEEEDGDELEHNMYLRAEWLFPIVYPGILDAKYTTRSILITGDRDVLPELQHTFICNDQEYLSEWKLRGMYPPQLDTQTIHQFDDIEMGSSDTEDQICRDHLRLRWYERGKGEYLLLLIDLKTALSRQFVIDERIPQEDSWCTIFRLEKPMNLRRAQRLVLKYGFLNLKPGILKDEAGLIIRHERLLEVTGTSDDKMYENLKFAKEYLATSRDVGW